MKMQLSFSEQGHSPGFTPTNNKIKTDSITIIHYFKK